MAKGEEQSGEVLFSGASRNSEREVEGRLFFGGLNMFEEEYYEENYAPDYDWREEEWYALTDGQYGDYPGGDIDYDALGFGD